MAPNETCVDQNPILTLSLTTHPASIRLAESLHDDTKVREALASLVKGCRTDVLYCSETVSDYCTPISDREPRDALLHHLFSGLCATHCSPMFLLVTQLLAAIQYKCKSLID